MTQKITRRSFTGTVAGVALSSLWLDCAASRGAVLLPAKSAKLDAAHTAIKTLETRNGGRLGVTALDTGSSGRISYRANERFAMCSTHKFLTAAAILALVDQGDLMLNQHVPYSQADLLEYAPVTRKNVGSGFMTVEALCAAAIEWSDNTAENLLLNLIGGPAGWTRYARGIGDNVSRLDRCEPALNSAIPGDPRDTTTPNAMTGDIAAVLLGTVLSEASRQRLENWMLGNKITKNLLRAGLPEDWRIGDKSGSGDNGTRNDIGIILPPNAAPILASVFYTQSIERLSSREALIAAVGHIIFQTFNSQLF